MPSHAQPSRGEAPTPEAALPSVEAALFSFVDSSLVCSWVFLLCSYGRRRARDIE